MKHNVMESEQEPYVNTDDYKFYIRNILDAAHEGSIGVVEDELIDLIQIVYTDGFNKGRGPYNK